MKSTTVKITDREVKAISNAAHWLKLLHDRDDGIGDAHEQLESDRQALVALLRRVVDA